MSEQVLSCDHPRKAKSAGETYCRECGEILEEEIHDKEYRAFRSEEESRKSREGLPYTFLKPNGGLHTNIGNGYSELGMVSPSKRGQYYRLSKWNKRNNNHLDRRTMKGVRHIKSLVSSLDLPNSMLEECAVLFRECLKNDVVKGRRREMISAAVVYIIARKRGIPRTLNEFSEAGKLDMTELGQNYKYVARELDINLAPVDALDIYSRYLSELELNEYNAEVREVLEEVRQSMFMSGRAPRSVVASVIYYVCKDVATQSRIARALSVTEVTVRYGYKDIQEYFDKGEKS